MGMVNKVVPHEKLEQTTYDWAQEIMMKSPTAIKMIKFGFNLIDDGLVGQQIYAGEAQDWLMVQTKLKKGKCIFRKRKPDFKKFPKFP